METFLIILISIFITVLLKSIFNLKKSNKKLPPGPSTFYIIVNFLSFYKSIGEFERVLLRLHAKLGPLISLRFGSKPAIFITDHSLAHQALVEKGAIFSNRPPSHDGTNQNYISTAFYGSTWRILRRNVTAEVLHSSRIKSYSDAREGILQNLLEGLKSQSRTGKTVHVMDNFTRSMFSLLALMCFGDKLKQEDINEIKKAQRNVLISFSRVSLVYVWPTLTKMVFHKQWKELLQARQQLKEVLIPLIRHRKNIKAQQEQKKGHEYILSYVDTLLDLQHPEKKRNLDEAEIVDLCSEFLNGGTDTTSTALQWTMANLVKFPHIQEKLYMQIKGVVGDANYVKEEDLQKMPYLKAVILEVLRRHPPGRFSFPHAVSEDTDLNGYVVPKNGTVNFMIGQMGMDPKVWKNPTKFVPERFLVNDNNGEEVFDITGSKEIKMMPFGVGRRICPGLGLAMLHLEYFVANLVWCFEWKSVDGDDVDLEEKYEFSVVMKNPLRAHLCPRLK